MMGRVDVIRMGPDLYRVEVGGRVVVEEESFSVCAWIASALRNAKNGTPFPDTELGEVARTIATSDE